MGKAIRRFLLWVLVLGSVGYLGYQMTLYFQVRQFFPAGTNIAGLDVSGLTAEEAETQLNDTYLAPVYLWYGDQALELDPADVNFTLDTTGMLAQAEQFRTEQNFWRGYFFHVIGWSWEAEVVPLSATHNDEQLVEMLSVVAGLLDEPPQPPQILSATSNFEEGLPGFRADVPASIEAASAALYRAEDRHAKIVVVDEPAPILDFTLLEDVILRLLNGFEGGTGSVYILDLATGNEITINSDYAMSGLSILKIGIFVEAYRALDNDPSFEVQQYFYDTAAASSNYGANMLLHVAAGENNTYLGADIFTESMQQLGLINTFMAVPYDALAPDYRPFTYSTPANSRPDAFIGIDPSRQSTAEDIGTLLAMIYYCSQGGGTLLAVYPDEITPAECQAIIDLMVQNVEGNLIRFGVPDGVPVSHKHGWVPNTHSDAGIVFSPGGDYVIVEYIHIDDGWLVSEQSFPVLREISRAVYNYYNIDDPYLGNALFEEERFDEDDPFFNDDSEADAEEEGVEEGDEEVEGGEEVEEVVDPAGEPPEPTPEPTPIPNP